MKVESPASVRIERIRRVNPATDYENKNSRLDASELPERPLGSSRRALITFPKAGLHFYSQILNVGLHNHISLSRLGTNRTLMSIDETVSLIMSSQGDLSGHFVYSPEVAEELIKNFDHIIYVTRNLRDVVCSLVDYINRYPKTLLDTDGLIGDAEDKVAQAILTVSGWSKMFAGWANVDLFRLTYEEGVSDKDGTIRRIHENIHDCGTIEEMTERDKWRTYVFNVGTVDRWIEYFTDEHKQLANIYFGPLLEVQT